MLCGNALKVGLQYISLPFNEQDILSMHIEYQEQCCTNLGSLYIRSLYDTLEFAAKPNFF
jgi:hypothetical protein